jgi:Flp pilus assembly protein TadD
MKPVQRRLAHAVLLFGLLNLSGIAARAAQPAAVRDGTPAIDQAITSGQFSRALSALDQHIASHPNDLQAKFKRATLLARLNRDDAAIAAFTQLTRQYPEVPEPYNNLAALYAKHGDLAHARATLETAVAANPAFALAYQNLGAVYLQLAEQAFRQAAQRNHSDALSLQRAQTIAQMLQTSTRQASQTSPTPPTLSK